MFERGEYWRLRDGKGKPPGLLGWWPSRAVTFLENHDTGSTQGHWRFPGGALEQGYAYILTHPGARRPHWGCLGSNPVKSSNPHKFEGSLEQGYASILAAPRRMPPATVLGCISGAYSHVLGPDPVRS